MKSELRMSKHEVIDGAMVVEIWHDGKFIGQVVGADGPGVRIITKHFMQVASVGANQAVKLLEVKILQR